MSSPLTSVVRAKRVCLLGVVLPMALACPVALHAQPAAPVPNSPAEAVALLKWCWEHRDAAKYRELFTADYHFVPGAPDLPWTREDELAAASHLFGSGTSTQPGATNLTVSLLGNLQPGSCFLPGFDFPVHQQILTPVALDMVRSDGSSLVASGPSLFYLVRGDLAQIPADLGLSPDPNRWYIERWDDVPASGLVFDHAPVVKAPLSTIPARAGSMVMIGVDAFDPDGDSLASLTAEGIAGANFVHDRSFQSGSLTWTPTALDTGYRTVTFTASNRLSGVASTTFHVLAGFLPPIAHLTATPASGNAPLSVTLDASGSADSDGSIASYRFEFDDGSPAFTQFSPRTSHVYMAGRHTASVRVTDNDRMVQLAYAAIVVNFNPTPNFTISPSTGSAPLQVTLNASSSMDADGTIVSYRFDFGDSTNQTQSAPSFTHTYQQAGDWKAKLTVTDDKGAVGTLEKTITVLGDHRPVVGAPAAVDGKAGQRISFSISAMDPDDQSISSLTAAGPPGSSFSPGVNYRSGQFTWTPGNDQIGSWNATFTASNTLVGQATTLIRVGPANGLPVATLVAQPTSGIEPLAVQFDASRSFDLDGQINQFRFDFGDGTVGIQSSPIASHSFMAGTWPIMLTVTDNDAATDTASATVTVSPLAQNPGAVDAVSRFATAWRDRSLGEYRALLTNDFRFLFATGDSVGDLYSGRAWNRDEELLAVGRLFSGGNGDEPPASAIDLRFLDNPLVGTSYQPGKTYPWHVQVLVPRLSLDIERTAPPRVHVEGQSLFSVVRGDSARLPQELIDLGFHPDSTQWYIEGWREMTTPTSALNQAPVASLAVTPATGVDPLTTVVDASRSHDDDGMIVAYRFDFGDGVSFLQGAPSATHAFAAGQWTVRVTAIDNRGAEGTASLPITVWAQGSQPNLARNPSFEIDLKGWNSYAGSVLQRIDGGHDGNIGLQITGPPVINGSFGVNDSPDMVRWTLGPGIRYRYTAWVRSPSSRGLAKLRVTEYLIAGGIKLGMATSTLVTLSPDWQQLTVDYVTTSANSTLDFQVRDFPIVPSEVFITDDITIRNVTSPGAGTGMAAWYDGEDPVSLQPRLVPSPIQTSGTLSFMTSQGGVLRVEILDLAGRRVRRLVDEREAPAGLYEFSIGPMADDGRRLGAGVYFYRIEAREGVRTGRFVRLQ